MNQNISLARKITRLGLVGLIILFGVVLPQPAAAGEREAGFRSLFDGKTLKNWDGNPKFWRVEQGAITGQTTTENPTTGNTFIIWRGGDVAGFELKLEYRIFANNDKGFGNSGIQYRSYELPNKKWVVGGYQADFEAGDTYSGILYSEQTGRGILAKRGEKTVVGKNGKPKVVGSVGDTKEIQAKIKKEDWNEYHIIAKGNLFIHKINGVVTSECTDEDVEGPKHRAAKGILALQLHAGPPMKVQFRNIRIKNLSPEKKGSFKFELNTPKVRVKVSKGKVAVDVAGVKVRVNRKKTIVLIAGKKSHGYGAHEHRAGCMLLAEALNGSGLPVEANVYAEGWPKDASVLDDADSIVIYADGGGRHPFNAHIEEIDKLMKNGVGLVCIHYGVEVPKGKSGDAFLDWTGGYFETNWSVNPHWTANYQRFPKHPITRGVKPFAINDEWYYHMRFRDKMEGVTPILTDLPPASTLVKEDGSLARPDNAHNNNPHVRKAVLEQKQRQHVAWAMQRKEGGRGFGFTGGHNHWNWGHNQFRKLVLNAIVWTAKVSVPQKGVSSKLLSVEGLMANQDYEPNDKFNPARIQAMLDQWNGKEVSAK
jgi:type 1 glutamine amidotransferase